MTESLWLGATVNFPVYLGMGAVKIHPYILFETIAYSVALRLSLRTAGIRSHQRSAV
jgi:NO-binding membrane sensor protein with MHYT domain